MPIVYQDLNTPIDSNYVRVAFDLFLTGKGDDYERSITNIILNEFDTVTNTGKWWSGEYFVNMFAWSSPGIFKRLNHSLYFYSDDSRKGNSQYPDFVLHYAPSAPYDYLSNRSGVVRDGVGKIINPRNPSWAGAAIEWYRTDVQPEDKKDEEERDQLAEERIISGWEQRH